MAYVADFDPTGFDESDPLTWPTPSPYSPGEWWYITAPGTISGVAVDLGDRAYPVGTGRLFGELDYGVDTYGGDVPTPPWPAVVERVRWVAVRQTAPAWERPPPPYAGCPFVRDGWRIVVEMLYVFDELTQTYGSGLYGDGTFGSADGSSSSWNDVTPAAFGLVVTRGAPDGSPLADVDELRADLVDVDAALFPLSTSGNTTDGVVREPLVGTPIRVSVLDPSGAAFPIFAGRTERIDDVHDRGVRTVSLDAFGFASDLATVAIGTWAREAEPVVDRLSALLDAAEWDWGIGELPDPVGPTLRRVDPLEQVNARTEADRAALSASWYLLTDRQGRLTARAWPLEVDTTVATLAVTDRRRASQLPSSSIVYVADSTELLNVVSASSEEVQGAVEIVRTAHDASSIGRFSRSSQSLGFPVSGLSARAVDLEAFVERVRDRFGRVVVRCESLEVDTQLDGRWLVELSQTDIGRAVRTVRTKPEPLVLDHVVVGVEHRLTRDRWSSTLQLSTLSETI